MKHLFSSFTIIIVISVLSAGCAKTISDTSTNESNHEAHGIVEQEETSQNEDETIERALYNAWGKSYKKIEISDDVVRLYLLKPIDAVFFLDAHPEKRARRDLSTFLKIAGRNNGTIEYYIPPPSNTKIFSITGSLTNAETKSYH